MQSTFLVIEPENLLESICDSGIRRLWGIAAIKEQMGRASTPRILSATFISTVHL